MLHYDAASGVFTWKVRPSERSNVQVGDVAGCVDKRVGYVLVRILGRLYLAHRLAWFYVTRRWPRQQIDHRDGNKGHNAFSNLRDVSNAVNGQNLRCAKRTNKVGLLGVSPTKDGRFRAYITPLGGKTKALGRFSTPEEAHAAYLAAKRQLHVGNTL